MRDARLDEDKVAGLIIDFHLQVRAVFMSDFALENVQHHLKIDVNMREGNASRRDCGYIHGQLFRADIFGG